MPRGPAWLAIAAIGWALASTGCASYRIDYRGTGAFRSGATTASSLAVHDVSITTCLGNSSTNPPVPHLDILTIGQGCAIDVGAVGESSSQECTLVFPEGPRTLRVTDVTFRWQQFDARRVPYAVEVRLGGDDGTGHHALYEFVGKTHGSNDQDMSSTCAAERKKRGMNSAPSDNNL